MAEQFLKRLESFAPLSDADKQTFQSLVQGERALEENETLFVEGQDQSNLFIVKSGWFYSYAILPDGSRQIFEIFTSGDVMGIEHLSWSKAMTSVAAASEGVVSRVPVREARQILADHPRHTAIFYALHMVHSVLLLDRITAVSRLGAYERLAYFLADALTRQDRLEGAESGTLHLPLSQTFIADCLGLSSVHVSRQVGKLVKNGVIEKQGRYDVIILDRSKLLALGDYTDRFAGVEMDDFDT